MVDTLRISCELISICAILIILIWFRPHKILPLLCLWIVILLNAFSFAYYLTMNPV